VEGGGEKKKGGAPTAYFRITGAQKSGENTSFEKKPSASLTGGGELHSHREGEKGEKTIAKVLKEKVFLLICQPEGAEERKQKTKKRDSTKGGKENQYTFLHSH